MSVIPTPAEKSKKFFPSILHIPYLFTPPYGFAGRRKPGLEVAGTNNYHLRNYDAKGAAATFTVDKSQRVRGGNCQDNREEEEKRRVFYCSTTFPLKYPLL